LEITQNTQKLQHDSRGQDYLTEIAVAHLQVGRFTLDYLVCIDIQLEITSGKQIYIHACHVNQDLTFKSV